MTVTLASLVEQTGLCVLDHLERSMTIPVIDGLQAQGDLIVVPYAILAEPVRLWPAARWAPVPPEGVELLRGTAGGHPHTLVAEPGTCRWTGMVTDTDGLTLGAFEATAPVYLLHAEHGATGCAPGKYAVRRQREFEGRRARLVAD